MMGFLKRRIVTSETLGERLRKVREGRGLVLGEVEAGINIRASYLRGLEEGDYSILPGEVYVKSFLKVYAVFLGLDENEVMGQYEKERKVDDYRRVAFYAAEGRDLFGNRARKGWLGFWKKIEQFKEEKGIRWRAGLGWKRIGGKKNFFRSIVLSQIFLRGVVVLLILGVLFYLGFEVKRILSVPDLTVLEPADNLVITEPRVVIKGVVEVKAILKINEAEVTYDEEGRFSEEIDLKEGLNEIKISAKKEHSRERVVWRRIVVE